MKRLISALILIALAVALVSLLIQGNGYALLGYGQWTVEGSLAMFILLDLALFFVLYLAIRTLARLWSVPERWQAWKKGRQRQRAYNSLASGLLDMAAGNWKSAEQKLLKHVDASDKPTLNYLCAARVAQERGAIAQRDSYLKLAQEAKSSEELAVSYTQAELQLSNDQREQALATLMRLREIAPKHGYVLKMLRDIYLRLEDWQALQPLLPEMRKSDVISKQDIDDLEVKIYVGLMGKAVAGDDAEGVDNLWKQMSKQLHSQVELVLIYAQHLMDKGTGSEAVRLLDEAIAKHWDERLVGLYGLAEGADISRQLNRAESWLKERPRNAVLLLALARICLRSRLWGKARSYLEASIGSAPSVEAYQELGILLEQMGENGPALDSYRSGLELASAAPQVRSWRYDGRKAQSDADANATLDLRQPLDAPLPVAGESS